MVSRAVCCAFFVWQAHCIELDKKFAEFEAAQMEISRWMDGAEVELCDIIKPTIAERVAVVDNSAPRIQVRSNSFNSSFLVGDDEM